MINRLLFVLGMALGNSHLVALQAQVYRWDNDALIPGTSEITVEPGAQLDHLDLEYAQLSGRHLTGVNFSSSLLTNANLRESDLSHANLNYARLRDANLVGSNLSEANLTGAEFTNADLSDSDVTGANFEFAVGFTEEQLYATSSYRTNNLQGINLSTSHDLTGWNFSGQNLADANLFLTYLTNANLAGSNLSNANLLDAELTGANLDGAIVTGANFSSIGRQLGISKEQLYATLSYTEKDLQGIGLWYNNLTGWDLSDQDLTNASLSFATLTDANLTGALVAGAEFDETTLRGFTKEQLYSTLSYQEKNLAGIGLQYNDLTEWNFSGQNLRNASLGASTLADADLSEAIVTGADFRLADGFTKEQLYSTVSYQEKDLAGISLQSNDLTNWDLSEQRLTGANLSSVNFEATNLIGSDLRNAFLLHARNIDSARFGPETMYNQWTIFPDNFDPVAAGLTFLMSPAGDLDANDLLDLDDIHLLATMIRSGSRHAIFDLNNDSKLDETDLDIWITDLKQTSIGDADLNGEFNREDLISLYQLGHYEDGVPKNSTWATGDFNADGEFTSLDLIKAFQHGGYTHGARGEIMNVPEPTNDSILLIAMASLIRRLRLNPKND